MGVVEMTPLSPNGGSPIGVSPNWVSPNGGSPSPNWVSLNGGSPIRGSPNGVGPIQCLDFYDFRCCLQPSLVFSKKSWQSSRAEEKVS